MAITTSSILPAAVQQSFNMKILATPTPNLIYKLPAMRLTMPRNGGKTLRSRRYNQLPTAPVPLGNSGVTPPAVTLTAVDIDATIGFYGQYIIINDQVTLQSEDPVLNAAAIRLGVSLRMTEDQLTRDMLASTASFINCTSGINGDNPTEITAPDIDNVVSQLYGNNAATISDSIEGADKFGTAPVYNAFFALTSTSMITDLRQVSGFINSAQYPNQGKVLYSELGSASNLRFFVSSVGSSTPTASADGNTVYNTICAGMEAYSCIEQDGYSARFIYRDPMYSGPLAQNCTVGYTFAEVPRILNDLWVLNLRSTLAV